MFARFLVQDIGAHVHVLIGTNVSGLLGFIHLMIAGGAVWKVTGGKWLWNIGGHEYCVFWAICCLIVAMHYSANAMPFLPFR